MDLEDREDEPAGVKSYDLFRSRPAGDWYKESPDKGSAQRLAGDLWLEGGLCVLFGDTGRGKSIFATQLADAIARGVSWEPFSVDTPPQKVLYFDFELTTAQFTARYSKSKPNRSPPARLTAFKFSPNLIRVEMSSDPPDHEDYGFKTFNAYFESALIDQIEQHRARVVVIDNLTYLSDQLHSSARAAHMMKELRRIQAELNLSILVLAHARPRRRPAALTLADVGAASPVAEIADSVIAIAPSTCGADVRYLKHLKSRTGPLQYDEQNVIVFSLSGEAPVTETADTRLDLSPTDSPQTAMISFDELVRQNRSAIAASSKSAPRTHQSASCEMQPASCEPLPSSPRFHHLGFSPESVHLIDHAKQAQQAERLERQQLRRSKNVVQMLMSREYKRYIES
ncbi:MAG: AAA family ATPase [Pyrinomonadaceae bacterium]